jgi:hypothetical protein
VLRTFPHNQQLATAGLPMVLALARVLSAYSYRNPVRPAPSNTLHTCDARC